MPVLVRVSAAALLAASGYAAYVRAQQIMSLVEERRPIQEVDVDALLLVVASIIPTMALGLIVLLARKSPEGDGGKPRFRFGGFARFVAALALLAGVRHVVNSSFNFYRIWAGDLLEQVLAQTNGLRVLGMEALWLVVVGLTSTFLALMVLFAPRRGA